MKVISTEKLIQEFLVSGRKLNNHFGYVDVRNASYFLINEELLKKYRLEYINCMMGLDFSRVYFSILPPIKNIKKIEI